MLLNNPNFTIFPHIDVKKFKDNEMYYFDFYTHYRKKYRGIWYFIPCSKKFAIHTTMIEEIKEHKMYSSFIELVYTNILLYKLDKSIVNHVDERGISAIQKCPVDMQMSEEERLKNY